MNHTAVRLMIAVLCCAYISPASAEVSRTTAGLRTGTIIMGLITEGPDPIAIWFDNGRVIPSLVLNASGHDRGDGAPDLAYRENGEPVAVWPYKAGTDFDIAFSEWNGTAWTTTEFLTSSTDSELDPRVFVGADGAIHVVWWVSGVDEVYLATRPAGATLWDAPLNVTSGSEFANGRRPSVIENAGTIYVAYERDTPEGSPGPVGPSQQIMVATDDGAWSFATDFLGASSRTGALDPVIHSENGKVWVDWIHTDDELGCVEREGLGWVGHPRESWTDPSWVGIEDTRWSIRRSILAE